MDHGCFSFTNLIVWDHLDVFLFKGDFWLIRKTHPHGRVKKIPQHVESSIRFGRSSLVHDFSQHRGTKLRKSKITLEVGQVRSGMAMTWQPENGHRCFPMVLLSNSSRFRSFLYDSMSNEHIWSSPTNKKWNFLSSSRGISPDLNGSQVLASCFSEDMERSMGFRRVRRRVWDIQKGFLVCKPWVTLYLLLFFHCCTLVGWITWGRLYYIPSYIGIIISQYEDPY